jgi:hypothetical protein
MALDPEQTAQLLAWLLGPAPPVRRRHFLTRLGRLRPRPLGAALFDGLLAAGRGSDALRLVRHAGALGEGELEDLLRRRLVDAQVGAPAIALVTRGRRPVRSLTRLEEIKTRYCRSRQSRRSATDTQHAAALTAHAPAHTHQPCPCCHANTHMQP